MRGPGIEPGYPAWKAGILTIGPSTLFEKLTGYDFVYLFFKSFYLLKKFNK